MRYRITFRPPNTVDNPWECVIYKDVEERPASKDLPLTSRKAHAIYGISLEVQSELNVGSFKLVRIEEVPKD